MTQPNTLSESFSQDVSRLSPTQVAAAVDRLEARRKELEDEQAQQDAADADRRKAGELQREVEELEQLVAQRRGEKR